MLKKLQTIFKSLAVITLLIFATNAYNAKADYCEPYFEYGCDWGDMITDFSISSTGYSFSDMSCIPEFQSKDVSDFILPETDYTLNFTVGYSGQYARIFVDWNENGLFDHEYASIWDGEISGTTLSSTLNIPIDKVVKAGQFRVLVVNRWLSDPPNPCDDYSSYGSWFSFDAWFGSADPDAAITDIFGPPAGFRMGQYAMYAKLENASEVVDLTSANVHWWLNGTKQGVIPWSGELEPGESTDIFLGNIDFTYPANGPFDPFYIEVRATNANGLGDSEEDGNPFNDYRARNLSPILNDAGIAEFTYPAGNFGTGNQSVKVLLTNFAPKPLNSVTIRWEVDGVQQTDYVWAGNLAYGQSTEVTIGTVEIFIKAPLAPFNFKARTLLPNGVADEYSNNDELTYSAAPALVPGTYTVGSSTANFESPQSLGDYLNASGIIGDGDVTFLINTGTYNGQVLFDDFPRGNNNFYIRSTTGNASDVKLQYAPTSGSNHIWRVNNVENVSFSDLTFVPQNTYGFSRGVYLSETINTNFNNVSFQGSFNPAGNPANHVFIYAVDADIIKVNNNNFSGGAIGFWSWNQYNVNNPMLEIANNKFNDFSYQGVYNAVSGSVSGSTDIHIRHNEFRAGANYNPNNGVQSIPGSMIHNNIFNGFNGTGGAMIKIEGNSSMHSAIYNNAINNSRGVDGIFVAGGFADVYDNTIVLDNESLVANTAGIKLANSNGGITQVYNNNITARLTKGLDLNSADAEVWSNRIHSTSNSAIINSNGASGWIANNHITGAGNEDGVRLANSNGLHFIYNSVYSLASQSAFHYAGSGTFIAQRNIIVNGGSGVAVMSTNVDRNQVITNNNNYFTFGTTFGRWDVTMLNNFDGWKSISLDDANSTNFNPEFASPTDLRLTKYIGAFAYNYPIELDLNDEQRMNYEGFDYWAKPRGENNTYFIGIDQIKPEIHITVQPTSITACENSTTTFMMTAVNVSLGAKPNYQWYKDGVEIPGATDAIIYFDKYSSKEGLEFNQAAVYSVRIGAEGGADEVWTQDAALYVVGETEILQQPESQNVEIGGVAVFEVKAHAKFLPPDYIFDYQWYHYSQSNDRITPLANDAIYSGVHTNILAVNVVDNSLFTGEGDYYFVEVRGLCGMAVSTQATITEKPQYGIVIVTQPQSEEACQGDAVTLTVRAETEGLTETINYQWYFNGQELQNGNNITGSKTNTLILMDAQSSLNGTYYVIAKDPESTAQAKSNNATVTITNPPVYTTPFEDQEVTVNDELTLTFEADGENLSYILYQNDAVVYQGEGNTAEWTFVDYEGNTAGIWRLVVAGDCGEVETIANVTIIGGGSVSVNETLFFEEVSPNPANSEMTIRYSSTQIGNTEIKIRDLSGAEVHNITLNSEIGMNNIRMDVSKLSNGVYFIELRLGNYSQTTKIIIAR